MATIRAMTTNDADVVARLAHNATQSGLIGRPTWERPDDVLDDLNRPGRSGWIVAEDEEGGLAGFAGFRLSGDGEAKLFGPVVVTEGHGIGAWMMSRIEAMAKEAGATVFSMLIGLENRSGAAWAEWQGYQCDTEEPKSMLMWLYPGELLPSRPIAEGKVRRAQPGELDRIFELYQESSRAGRLTRNDWEARLDGCWVVDANGSAQGFVCIERPGSRIAYFCVDGRHRRKGLGGALIASAVTDLWKERTGRVGLAVRLDNGVSISLFRRLGFREEIAVAKWMKR